MSEVAIAILAGGESRRMGRDKAALPVAGVPMLDRVLTAARSTGRPVWVIGRAAPAEVVPGVAYALDDQPGQGPLGGLATALRLASTDVLALACDLPALTGEAVAWLLAQPPAADGVAVVTARGVEPLFALYRRGVAERVIARLAAGRRSLQGLIADGEFAEVPAPHWLVPLLHNVNTPEDLK